MLNLAHNGIGSTSVELMDKGAAGIKDYLRDHQPDSDPENKLGIKHEALDTFARSLAG